MKKATLFSVLILTPLLGQQSSDCPPKFLTDTPFGPEYRREIFFPWFVVGQGWETRVKAYYLNRSSAGIRIYITPFNNDEEVGVRSSFPLQDGEYPYRSIGAVYRTKGAELHIDNVVKGGEIVLGSIRVTFFADKESNPCMVNWGFEQLLWAQLTYIKRDADGIVRWQISQPGFFTDQLSPRWSAYISISSVQPDGRQFRDLEDPAFAIGNPTQKRVKIRVRVFNSDERPWLDHQGQVWKNNPLGSDAPEAINTLWYKEYQEKCLTKYMYIEPLKSVAYTVRDFFRAAPEHQSLCGENPLLRGFPDQFFMGWRGYPEGTSFGDTFGFWGYVLFEAIKEDGSIDREAKIIPIVIQRIGDSLANVPLGRLPAETSFAEWQNQGN